MQNSIEPISCSVAFGVSRKLRSRFFNHNVEIQYFHTREPFPYGRDPHITSCVPDPGVLIVYLIQVC